MKKIQMTIAQSPVLIHVDSKHKNQHSPSTSYHCCDAKNEAYQN